VVAGLVDEHLVDLGIVSGPPWYRSTISVKYARSACRALTLSGASATI
jgi:hypothetical protein